MVSWGETDRDGPLGTLTCPVYASGILHGCAACVSQFDSEAGSMDESLCPQCGEILGTHVKCPMCMKYLVIEGASMILPEDVKEAREKAEEWFRGRGKEGPPELISQMRRLYGMICDHLSGSAVDYPFRTISLAAFGILYVVNPMDLIPDPIKRVGYIDDSVMLAWVAEAMGETFAK